ncbi:MAG: type II secretion system F family protein [Proteobacteria bacterium]|nr:type II secretion system F family protein [Pseudomonadota bacterium]
MIKFRYKAASETGKYFRGEMSAENQSDLEALLKDSKLTLISCTPIKPTTFGIGEKLNTKDLITLFSHLEQLERIGVPIIESLADIKDSSDSSKVRNTMQGIHEAVRNGNLLSEAMAKQPKVFDPIFVGLIANGEKSGNLCSTFSSIVEHIKWTDDIKRKTGKAIRYPLFSLVVMFGVLWIMTTVVVPKVTSFLQAQQIEMPGITVALVAFSNFMQTQTFTLFISIIGTIALYKILRQNAKFALFADGIKLKLPIFGQIITKLDISRFCHFFSMTFKSGTGVLECLESAKTVINNTAIRESVDLIRQQVADGQPLSTAISYTGYFPNLVVRMFKIGEESGNMEENLENVRYFYDKEINDAIDKMVGMIQPTLTLVMGGMMAWITIAVFGPIYSTFSNL